MRAEKKRARFGASVTFPLAPTVRPVYRHKDMSMEFGWWDKNPETGKQQICVTVHGGNITWECKQGHHSSWETYGPPTEADWDKLLAEAARRVPRRLLSPKQFADIERLRPR